MALVEYVVVHQCYTSNVVFKTVIAAYSEAEATHDAEFLNPRLVDLAWLYTTTAEEENTFMVSIDSDELFEIPF